MSKKLKLDPVTHEFKTPDHPEAGGRKPLAGEAEYPMTFTSDMDERIIIRMGQSGFETVTNLLTDMLANMPAHDDGSLASTVKFSELKKDKVRMDMLRNAIWISSPHPQGMSGGNWRVHFKPVTGGTSTAYGKTLIDALDCAIAR